MDVMKRAYIILEVIGHLHNQIRMTGKMSDHECAKGYRNNA
jgi:hypothetical protein